MNTRRLAERREVQGWVLWRAAHMLGQVRLQALTYSLLGDEGIYRYMYIYYIII
mgnify:CR=1 FL=1